MTTDDLTPVGALLDEMLLRIVNRTIGQAEAIALRDEFAARLTAAGVRVAPSPTEPPCGDDSWDTRYECVKPSGHPVEGPGLTSHEYRFKRATSGVAPSPDALDPINAPGDPGIPDGSHEWVAPSPDAPGLRCWCSALDADSEGGCRNCGHDASFHDEYGLCAALRAEETPA